MTCPICGSERDRAFSAMVLQRHVANFHYCRSCGYLGAVNVSWLDEAYASPIAIMDTGLLARNQALARRTIALGYALLGRDSSSVPCLDFAGGYGLLTRLMRDAGFNYLWSDKYSDNLFARGFEYQSSHGACHVVSAFEVLEHTPDPVGFVQEAFDLAQPEVMLFTTELFDGAPPEPSEWWYYAFETGQHISFFQRRTLQRIAEKLSLSFSSHRGLHAFSRRSVSVPLRIAGGRLNRALELWARMRLPSRTFSDLELIRRGLREENP